MRKALISRTVDFWLLGGASVAIWVAMFGLDSARGLWAISHYYDGIAAASAFLALLINYPHFVVSYKNVYGRGWKFIKSHWFQLLALPLSALVFFTACYLSYNDDSSLSDWLNPFEYKAGQGLLSMSIMLMFVSLGWHYSQQIYNCMIIYSKMDGYVLDGRQKAALKWLLRSIWILNIAVNQAGTLKQSDYFGVPYFSLGMPLSVSVAAKIINFLILLWFAFDVPYRNWRQSKQLPSPQFMVPLVAFFTWLHPIFGQHELTFYLVPIFHALQYLPLAASHDESHISSATTLFPKWTIEVFTYVIAGFLVFELIPDFADTHIRSPDLGNASFFFVSITVLVNMHHFLIDNLIWRARGAENLVILEPNHPADKPIATG